ncbi:MAG: HAMP domain-containing sensor histidine kinase [Anaerolineae bacterium]
MVAGAAAVMIPTVNQLITRYDLMFNVEGRLSDLAHEIRYYDAVLTNSVQSYVMNPADNSSYVRYNEYAAALDAVIAEARSLITSSNPEDYQFFDDIDRVNQELVAIERDLMAEPSVAITDALFNGLYGTLKAEYAGYVDQFIEDQTAEYEAYFAESRVQLTQTVTLITGLMLVLFALTSSSSYFSARYFNFRIQAVKDANKRFAQGDLKARALVFSSDEIGELAVNFNEMAARHEQNVHDLKAARRTAEEAVRMKDLFLATMSHELRTPLNAMIGFLHLMLFSGQLDEDNEHMADRALANTQRLLTLINNILDLSRIATGGLEIVPIDMKPAYVASSLYNELKVLASDKDVRLELEVDPALPEVVHHDEVRISQIVTNLVGNAIKFTQQGTVKLAFKQRDDHLVIEVTDTGIGIPQSKQHLIFDDFFQVDSTSTRKQQGAGLGLAIVRRLVMLMKGTISLKSEIDQGSTFTVDLPLNLPRYEPRERGKRTEYENVFVRNTGVEAPALQPAGGGK